MRILFLTQVLPYPLVGGAKIRAYYMLQQLAREHEVVLVSFVRDDDRAQDIDHLRGVCSAVYTVPILRSMLHNGRAAMRAVITNQPLVIASDDVPDMVQMLRHLVDQQPFDVVHADQTAMAQYALLARDCHTGVPPRTVLDQHNALYRVVERQAQYEPGRLRQSIWQQEARRLKRYEAELIQRFDHVLTVTDVDRNALLGLLTSAEASHMASRITALPICVDPDTHRPIPQQPGPPNILHLGTMFWPPNVEGVVWFANEVLPRVRKTIPDVTFTIAGKQPPPEVKALSAETGIDVTGFVADPTPLLARCGAFIVPLRAGGGMRVKILDGWQWGLPIVSTTIGAEGILTLPERNILLADSAEEFADAVSAVLQDQQLAANLRRDGRRWVETQYNWRTTYSRLSKLYAKLGSRVAVG